MDDSGVQTEPPTGQATSSDHFERNDRDIVMELKDVSATFEMDRGAARVLDNVSLAIERGEILGVVGESGSGKSMFASALMDAIDEPGRLDGEVWFTPQDGESFDVTDLDPEELRQFRWEDVSMVFQGAMSSFNPVRRIKTAFIETFVAHDVPVKEGLERARDILSDLHLDPDRVFTAYPHELSGGMRQRALIALSLVLDPDVLVMDEPTAALDLLMQRSIISMLEKLRDTYDLTIVFITHDLSLVSGLVDRIAVLYAFEFIEIGPTMEVLREPTHPYTRALLRSAPDLEIPVSEMTPINGESPDPVDGVAGCSYHPRCSLATEQCKSTDPEWENKESTHRVTCHHWEDAVADIPIPDEETEVEGADINGYRAYEEEPLVSLTDLEVSFDSENSGLVERLFGSTNPIQAVDDVSLDIYENDVVVIVGESGCGKSTLGKAAVGIQEPTTGTVEYRGQDIWKARQRLGEIDIPWGEIRRHLQIVHQDPGSSLNPNRRVKSILGDPLKRWRKEKNAVQRRTVLLTLLREVGLTPADDYLSRYPHQLSGGEKQRVALVRAFLTNPQLIFADEPVSALDVSLRVEIMDLMIRLQELFGTSFLFVSHDLANARYIANQTGGRIGVMYLGEIVEIGPAEQIINDPQHPYTQALRWATPALIPEEGAEPAPIRDIDVPDARNVPGGCRYHTRCQYAREACTDEPPALAATSDEQRHTRCFRSSPDHEYWNSDPIYGRENQ